MSRILFAAIFVVTLLIVSSTGVIILLQNKVNIEVPLAAPSIDSHGCSIDSEVWCDLQRTCINTGQECAVNASPVAADEISQFIEEIQELVQIKLAQANETSFAWKVGGTGEKNKISVNGREYNIADVAGDTFDKLASAFDSLGFQIDINNVITDTNGSVTGYKLNEIVCLLTTSNSQVKCGILNGIAPTDRDSDEIANLLSQIYTVPVSQITVSFTDKTDTRSKGIAVINGTSVKFLAARDEGEWVIAYYGNGEYECADLIDYNFPQYMIDDCSEY